MTMSRWSAPEANCKCTARYASSPPLRLSGRASSLRPGTPLSPRPGPPFRLHQIDQNIIDARQVPLALAAQPIERLLIETHGHRNLPPHIPQPHHARKGAIPFPFSLFPFFYFLFPIPWSTRDYGTREERITRRGWVCCFLFFPLSGFMFMILFSAVSRFFLASSRDGLNCNASLNCSMAFSFSPS